MLPLTRSRNRSRFFGLAIPQSALDLDFLSGTLDPRITFTRASNGTFFGSNGLLQTAANDVPRFDYDPVTLAARGLLIEEQRTNLLTWSENFGDAVWGKTAATVTANSAVAPDGTQTADSLIESTTTDVHQIRQTFTATGAQSSFSIYVKPAGRSVVKLVLRESEFSGAVYADPAFDVANGSVVSAGVGQGATIQSVGNGWYRCTAIGTPASGTRSAFIRMINGTDSYTGDGTSGILLWGAQLEAGAFPTSYIPTTSATATRAADLASMTGTNFSSWFNASEGTLFAEYNIPFALAFGTFPRIFALIGIGGAAVDDLPLFVLQTSGKSASFNSFNAGVNAGRIDASPLFVANTIIKAAACYTNNDRAVTANGEVPTTSATAYTIPTIVIARIGAQDNAGISMINGYIRRIVYWPVRVPNSQLQFITA